MITNKNILITGGSGFIGSHVVRTFVSKYPDYNIFNFDNSELLKNIASREYQNYYKSQNKKYL